MAEYDLNKVLEDVVIKLGESRFRLLEVTQALSEKTDPIEKRLKELDDSEDERSEDEVAELLISLVDTVTDPCPVEGGTRSHAKTVLTKAYKNGEIGIESLAGIADFLREKIGDRRRPTSDLLTEG